MDLFNVAHLYESGIHYTSVKSVQLSTTCRKYRLHGNKSHVSRRQRYAHVHVFTQHVLVIGPCRTFSRVSLTCVKVFVVIFFAFVKCSWDAWPYSLNSDKVILARSNGQARRRVQARDLYLRLRREYPRYPDPRATSFTRSPNFRL